MTTVDLLDRLAARLNLTPAQRDALLPELADAVRDGLRREGRVGLGSLGHLRLGVQEARNYPDGYNRPARAVIWLRPSDDLTRSVDILPVTFAREVARDTTPRNVWDTGPARCEREGVGRG